MKPRLYSYLAIVLASAVLVYSCKKGDTGPAGPAGPAGSAGAAGAPGPKGDTGTANVIYSAWTDVAFQPVITDTGTPAKPDTLFYVAAIVAPKLTANIISKGQISVYLNAGSAASPNVFPLPYTDILFQGFTIQVNYVADSIYLTANFDASTQTPPGGVKIQQYRYIIIPGAVPASADKKDYNSIKNYFKLPD